ncbi:MAG: glycosyltransferase family 9 protein [Fusobacteriaceae bacterium]|nr:glycosyltransferase family 9 protein [Fusobacteriaceae bacterium]
MKILVVRFKQIGDAILASVICDTLKKTFPDAVIDYVLYDFVTPIFENHHSINRVISIDKGIRNNFFKYIKFVWNVTRKEKYDIVIDIMATPKSELFTLFSWSAKLRIGRFKKWRGYSYTHKIKESKNAKDKCWKFLSMLKPIEELGYELDYVDKFIINITESEKNILKNRMKNAGLDFREKITAFAINSRRPEKIYPKEYMKELIILYMKKNPKVQIVFFYSPDELEYALNMHEELKEFDKGLNEKDDNKGFSKRIFSNITTKSIRELAMLLKNCDYFIGNEGGPRHLAQGVGTQSFAIFSPKSKKRDWMPVGDIKHTAIEPEDFVKEGVISKEKYDGLSYEEKYKVMTPSRILEKISM